MISSSFTFKSGDGTEIFVHKWSPNAIMAKGVVQIAHGMAEAAARYERFANVLTGNGYIVYANDHRGHGKTASSIEALGYLADKDGFKLLVNDMYDLSKIIKNENSSLPLFLFGHSMGSFAAQRYITLYGREIEGVIISGSNGKQGVMLNLGLMLAKREIKKYGRKAISHKLNNIVFGSSLVVSSEFKNSLRDLA